MDGRTSGRAPLTAQRRATVAAATQDGFDGFYRETYSRIAAALTYTLGDGDLATEAADEAMARAFAR